MKSFLRMSVTLLVALSGIAIPTPSPASSESDAHSSCLAPLLRKRELESLIFAGTREEQEREGKAIVAWFRSHAEQIEAWNSKGKLSPEDQRARQKLAAEMHQKLREWSLIVQLTDVTRTSVVLSESTESVLELYLKVIGADPQVDRLTRTIAFGNGVPLAIRQTAFGRFLRAVRSREVKPLLSLESFAEQKGTNAWFQTSGKARAAFSHRALAEMAPGANEVHEMAHILHWSRQMQNRDLLFAGWHYDPAAGEIPLDEFVAHLETISFLAKNLEDLKADPLRRLEWLRGIQNESRNMLEYGKALRPVIERAETMLNGRRRIGVEVASRGKAPGVAPGDDVGFDFLALPPGAADDLKDHQFLLEFPQSSKGTSQRRIQQRLMGLRSYLVETLKPLESLLELADTADTLSDPKLDLQRLQNLVEHLQRVQKDHRARYEGAPRPRSKTKRESLLPGETSQPQSIGNNGN